MIGRLYARCQTRVGQYHPFGFWNPHRTVATGRHLQSHFVGQVSENKPFVTQMSDKRSTGFISPQEAVKRAPWLRLQVRLQMVALQ